MHHAAAVGDQRLGADLIPRKDAQPALGHQVEEEAAGVLGVHEAGGTRHRGRQVGRTEDLERLRGDLRWKSMQ